jgi:hypothetical protein
MLNRTALARIVLSVAFIPCLAMAADKVALPPMSAAQIVDKNAAARGGLAAWRAVQTMSWKGKMGAGASTYVTVSQAGQLQTKQREEAQLPFTLDFKRPLKTRVGLRAGSCARTWAAPTGTLTQPTNCRKRLRRPASTVS